MEKNMIRPNQMHRLLKYLSPKRRGKVRVLCRSITPEAVKVATDEINKYVEDLVNNCEESLKELNTNPNNYYKLHKYDKQVMRMAIERMKNKDST